MQPEYQDGTPNPNYYLKAYKLLGRVYDKGGKFIGLIPIKGIDTTKPDDSCYLVFYETITLFAGATDDVLYLNVIRSDCYMKPDGINTTRKDTPNLLKIVAGEVVWQKDFGFYSEFINENNDYGVFAFGSNTPQTASDTTNKNALLVVRDTSDFSLKQVYKFHTGLYTFTYNGISSKNDFLFTGWKNEFIPPSSVLQYYEVAGILSSDVQTLRVYSTKDTNGSYRNILEVSKGKYMIWGCNKKNIFRVFLEDEDFVEMLIYTTNGIQELFLPSEFNSKAYPNPTEATSTLTLELQTAGVLTITLNDLFCAELFEIHNAFIDTGNSQKHFLLKHFHKACII